MNNKKHYTVCDAYLGNVKISVYDVRGALQYYTIVNDYNKIGYCKCLEDMGYVKHEEEEE